MSPDPADLAAVDPTNPQSWNRYTYVLNNPTSFTDPLGLLIGTGVGDDTLDQVLFLLENGGSWGDNFGQVVGGGIAPNPVANVPLTPSPTPMLSAAVPCGVLGLNNPSTFSDAGFATPQQVGAFFQAQASAPGSWDGAYAASVFVARGINPGVAVGIVGAETSFGGGPPLSAANVANPFSCDHSAGFDASAGCAAGTVADYENSASTPGTPLAALINRQNPSGLAYEGDQPAVQQRWMNNVNNWFRKLANFLGKCQ